MANYTFSADRQLIFYVNIDGQQRLVRFGERNAFGCAMYQTLLSKTAEAIRRHSLFKRGVIKETTVEVVKPATNVAGTVAKPTVIPEKKAVKTVAAKPAVDAAGTTAKAENTGTVVTVKNFTQAKRKLAKLLEMNASDIKTPDQLTELAKKANISIKYDND